MDTLAGKGVQQQNNSASEIEKAMAIAFIVAYFFLSKLLTKFTSLSMPISLILIAVIALAGAHQLDKRRPFPNKHFWKMITILLIVPVFLLTGV